MTSVFLFGTLCHAPLFERVAGVALDARPASLPNEAVVWVEGENFPMLTQGEGTEGLVVDVDADTLARMDFYEACFGYRRERVEVQAQGGLVSAEAWRPTRSPGAPGAAWSLLDWVRDHGAVAVQAAAEVMRQIDSATPQEIARRYWMIAARAQAHVTASTWQRPGLVGSGLGRADVELEQIKHPYTGFFAVEETRARFRKFDGGWSKPVHRESFLVADAVTVLPYDPLRDRILLVEQARFGALSQGDPSPWLLEPIAGMIDAGEGPESSARRETREEAGLELGALHFVSRYYPSPGGIAQVFFSYVAEAELPDDVTGVGGSLHENEDILSHLVPFDQAVEMMQGGDFANAPLLVSFQWLMMNRARLRGRA